jgi:hypothetical protein
MEEIKVRSGKEPERSEQYLRALKSMVSAVELTEMLGKGRRASFGKWRPPEYGRWGMLYEAASEREALGGLKFADELSEVKKQVDDLSSQVESVVSELEQCKEGISTILNELKGRPITKQTELFEIDETLELIRPIPVVIEEYDDEVIATFPEIEAVGAGLCESEAIINLKKEIRKIFFELEGVSDNKLGRLPLGWKRVLLKVVKKIGNSQ